MAFISYSFVKGNLPHKSRVGKFAETSSSKLDFYPTKKLASLPLRPPLKAPSPRKAFIANSSFLSYVVRRFKKTHRIFIINVNNKHGCC